MITSLGILVYVFIVSILIYRIVKGRATKYYVESIGLTLISGILLDVLELDLITKITLWTIPAILLFILIISRSRMR